MLSSSYTQFSNSTTAAQLRQPRAIVTINGTAVLWQNIEVTTTTFYLADSYRVVIPLSGQPPLITLQYLVATDPMTIRIYMGFPTNPLAFSTADLDLFMVGDIDKLDIDPLSMTATFSGRDFTSRFIDTKTYNKYPNQSAASIATQLAAEHGLVAQVTQNSDSLQKVGPFYANENTLINKETTEWDLLCFLAQQINFVCYVQSFEQPTLIFAPRVQTEPIPVGVKPYILNYLPPNPANQSPQFSGMYLTISRSLTLAQDVVVKVRVPVNPLTGRAYTKTLSRVRTAIGSPLAQTYTYTFPGLTPQQAINRGQQLLNDITLHELRLDAQLPGDNLLRKDSLIQLIGTGTTMDQLYYADQVVRNMTLDGGYSMQISAKNHSVDSEVII